MTGDKPVLDVYLGERQIANITLIMVYHWRHFMIWLI
ncbi:HipA protein [Legionella pneumophila]|nr:HipA protein [Legionella pneumophila]